MKPQSELGEPTIFEAEHLEPHNEVLATCSASGCVKLSCDLYHFPSTGVKVVAKPIAFCKP